MTRLAMAGLLVATGLAGIAAAQTPAAQRSTPETLYQRECAICHAAGGTGTLMLARRLRNADAILANRKDLDADYVKAVVRRGINSMPAITRVEVTDAELDAITSWLVAGKR